MRFGCKKKLVPWVKLAGEASTAKQRHNEQELQQWEARVDRTRRTRWGKTGKKVQQRQLRTGAKTDPEQAEGEKDGQQHESVTAVQESRGQQIRRMIVLRKANEARELQRSERSGTEGMEGEERAEQTHQFEEEEEEMKRQAWEAAATEVVRAKWQRVGSLSGEAGSWHLRMIKTIRAHCRTLRAWGK